MVTNPHWYRVMLYRIGGDILGGKIGTLVAVCGFVAAIAMRRGSLVFAYLASIVAFFVIVAEGQIDAPYRQLTIVPPASILLGVGVYAMVTLVASLLPKGAASVEPRALGSIAMTLGVAIVTLVLLVHHASSVFGRDPEAPVDSARWLLAGEIRKHSRPDSRLITAGEYTIHKGGNDLSPVLYYYSRAQGWSLQKGQWDLGYVNELRRKGADLFAAVQMSREPESRPFLEQMKAKYPVLYEDRELRVAPTRSEKRSRCGLRRWKKLCRLRHVSNDGHRRRERFWSRYVQSSG